MPESRFNGEGCRRMYGSGRRDCLTEDSSRLSVKSTEFLGVERFEVEILRASLSDALRMTGLNI